MTINIGKYINKILKIKDMKSQISLDRAVLTAEKPYISEFQFAKRNAVLNERSYEMWLLCDCVYGHDKDKYCKLCGRHKDLL